MRPSPTRGVGVGVSSAGPLGRGKTEWTSPLRLGCALRCFFSPLSLPLLAPCCGSCRRGDWLYVLSKEPAFPLRVHVEGNIAPLEDVQLLSPFAIKRLRLSFSTTAETRNSAQYFVSPRRKVPPWRSAPTFQASTCSKFSARKK